MFSSRRLVSGLASEPVGGLVGVLGGEEDRGERSPLGQVVEQADRDVDLRVGEQVVLLAAEVEHGLAAALEAVAGLAGEHD